MGVYDYVLKIAYLVISKQKGKKEAQSSNHHAV